MGRLVYKPLIDRIRELEAEVAVQRDHIEAMKACSIDYNGMAQEIKRLEAEVERLREALEEIASHDRRTWTAMYGYLTGIARKALGETE